MPQIFLIDLSKFRDLSESQRLVFVKKTQNCTLHARNYKGILLGGIARLQLSESMLQHP